MRGGPPRGGRRPRVRPGRPVREDPDDRRVIGRVRALEAVAQPVSSAAARPCRRRRPTPRAPGAPDRPRRERPGRSRDVCRSGWATRTRSDGCRRPGGRTGELREALAPDGDVPSAEATEISATRDAWLHPWIIGRVTGDVCLGRVPRRQFYARETMLASVKMRVGYGREQGCEQVASSAALSRA